MSTDIEITPKARDAAHEAIARMLTITPSLLCHAAPDAPSFDHTRNCDQIALVYQKGHEDASPAFASAETEINILRRECDRLRRLLDSDDREED